MHSQESNGHNGRDSQDPAGLRRPGASGSFVRERAAGSEGGRWLGVCPWLVGFALVCLRVCFRVCVRVFVSWLMSPALYVSVSLATCGGLCRFGEAWAALGAGDFTHVRFSFACSRVSCPGLRFCVIARGHSSQLASLECRDSSSWLLPVPQG